MKRLKVIVKVIFEEFKDFFSLLMECIVIPFFVIVGIYGIKVIYTL